MEYHKDQLAFTDRMEYLRAPLVVQAAHQWLIRYCARRETGGTIADCKNWKDRDWGIATNGQLRAKDVAAVVAAGLARYDGEDLVVEGYDRTGEEQCRFNRSVGRLGGRPPKRSDNHADNRSVPENKTQSSPVHTNPVREAPTPSPAYQLLEKSLRRRGMSASPKAVREWSDFLQGSILLKDPEEAPRALELIAAAAKRDGITVTYYDQAAPYADQVARILKSERAQGVTA